MANQRESFNIETATEVAMIDPKYHAGFVDADGSVMIFPVKLANGRYSIHPKIQVGQLSFRADILHEIADEYDVPVREKKGTDFSTVELTGRKATTYLNLIKGHMVVKDEVTEYILSLPDTVSKDELKGIKLVIKGLRKKNTPTKNHPSRRWMAGYIDGDGCFDCTVKQNGTLSARLTIASSVDALAGCNLIHKAFGGNMTYKGNTAHYQVSLGVHKMRQIYDFCGKHLRIKKTQAELLMHHVGNNRHSVSQGGTLEKNKEFQKLLATTKYLGR